MIVVTADLPAEAWVLLPHHQRGPGWAGRSITSDIWWIPQKRVKQNITSKWFWKWSWKWFWLIRLFSLMSILGDVQMEHFADPLCGCSRMICFYDSMYIILVGGLDHFFFHSVGNFISSPVTDSNLCQRGRHPTNQLSLPNVSKGRIWRWRIPRWS